MAVNVMIHPEGLHGFEHVFGNPNYFELLVIEYSAIVVSYSE